MGHGGKRHAFISVFPEAFFRQSPACHRIQNFDLDICRGLHGLGDYGFTSAPARFWDCGARCFVKRFMLGVDEAAVFFEGSMRACRRVRFETTGAVETRRGHAVDYDSRLLEARGKRLSGSVGQREA